MRLRKRHAIVVAFVSSLALLQCGCALKPTAGPSPEKAWHAADTVGVASPPDGWKRDLETPSGRGIAAARGAGQGALAGVRPGVAILGAMKGCGGGGPVGAVICGSILLVGLGIAGTGGVVGALGGALYGAASTETPSMEIGKSLNRTVAQVGLQESFQERVLEAAQRAGLTAVRLPSGAAAKSADMQAGREGRAPVDTILELALDTLEMRREGSGPGLPVALVVSARARLVRVADGRELYRHVARHHGGSWPYAEWAADDSRHLREALATASVSMAAEIVDVISLGVKPPSPAPPSRPGEIATAGSRYRPSADSRERATKEIACRNRHLAFRSDWRDQLLQYRACLAD